MKQFTKILAIVIIATGIGFTLSTWQNSKAAPADKPSNTGTTKKLVDFTREDNVLVALDVRTITAVDAKDLSSMTTIYFMMPNAGESMSILQKVNVKQHFAEVRDIINKAD